MGQVCLQKRARALEKATEIAFDSRFVPTNALGIALWTRRFGASREWSLSFVSENVNKIRARVFPIVADSFHDSPGKVPAVVFVNVSEAGRKADQCDE